MYTPEQIARSRRDRITFAMLRKFDRRLLDAVLDLDDDKPETLEAIRSLRQEILHTDYGNHPLDAGRVKP